MTYGGIVRGGVVVLDGGVRLPEGTIVSVRVLAAKSGERKRRTRGRTGQDDAKVRKR
jgi:hypothetical protein